MHSSLPVSAPSGRFSRALLHGGLCATGVLLGTCYQNLAHNPSSRLSADAALSPAAPSASWSTTVSRSPLCPPSAASSTDADTVTLSLKKIAASSRNSHRKNRALTAWIDTATETDLRYALILGPKIFSDSDDVDTMDSLVLTRLAEIDGEMAQAVMNALTRDDDHSISLSAKESLFEAWAAWDPQGAARGAVAQLARDGRPSACLVIGVLDEIAADFPSLANDLASQLARSDDEDARSAGFDAHIDLMLRQVGEGQDYTSAFAWIATHQVSPEERQNLLEALVTHGLQTSNLSSALAAFRQIDGPADPGITAQLIRNLAATDPATARQLALAQPEGEARELVALELTRGLFERKAATEIVQWLSAQPPSSDFDQSYTYLSKNLAGTDPETAWRCATLLSPDSDEKPALSHQAASRWLETDFAAASQTLPADVVQKYQLTHALLAQIAEINSGAVQDFSLNWRPAPSSLVRRAPFLCGNVAP